MRQQSIVIWVMLGFLLLALLNLPESLSQRLKSLFRDGLAPLQAAATGLSSGVREAVKAVRGLGDLAGDNRKMAVELAALRSEARELKVLGSENAVLREHLGFARQSERKLVPCEVIARDIVGWWQTIRLGKGANQGLLPNMAVITPDGLVGKTVAVSAQTCDVLLISDPSCRVAARVSRTGAFGILSGRGHSERGMVTCNMEFINKNLPVQPGDEIVTSGLGGVFPKDLPIGYADAIRKDESGLYQMADVVPRADLGRLEYVFVVTEQSAEAASFLQPRAASRSEEKTP